MTQGDEGFGLYIHWPFCLSKCPYCDFNSHVAERIDQPQWREALLTELAHYAARTKHKTLTSIFFGGGTPSLMDPDTTAALIEAARRHWPTVNDLEITLEANPGTVDAERFAAIRAAGVNRLSMGVQSLRETDLKFLGRRHDVNEARQAWRTAAKIFPRVSFDLIYARPGQTLEGWRTELGEALREVADHNIAHLSLYQLTMEPGTAMFDAHARGEFILPTDDAGADFFELTQELCEAAGYPAYEISNHARDDAACRHNLTYWRGGDYVGVGPGAHGRITENGKVGAARQTMIATRQIKAPALWLKRVAGEGQGTQEEDALSPETRAQELVMVGLRLAEGLDKARFTRLTGLDLGRLVDAEAVAALEKDGYLADNPAALKATPKGRVALNALLRELLV